MTLNEGESRSSVSHLDAQGGDNDGTRQREKRYKGRERCELIHFNDAIPEITIAMETAQLWYHC